MEATRFELSAAIDHWRAEFAGSPALRPADLDELEAHLRESIASLQFTQSCQSTGLSEEEAFLIASRRLGSHVAITSEFGKSNTHLVWLDRIFWTLIAVQTWSLISGFFGSIARSALAYGLKTAEVDFMSYSASLIGLNSKSLFPVALFGLTSLVAMGASLACCWWLFVSRGREIAARLEPWLTGQWKKLATLCVGLCLVTLLGNASRFAFGFFLGSGASRQANLYEVTSLFFIAPLQVVALILATLLIARRRLSVNRPHAKAG